MSDISIAIREHVTKDDGFYIECGANDGVEQSNTLFYELYKNWRGLLIEASPSAWAKCRFNRSTQSNIIENCALVSADYVGDTVTGDFDGNLMSSVGGLRRSNPLQIEVPARTLSSLLDQHGIQSVDLFSLDVEGFELNVLKGLDLTRHRPTWMVIEVYDKFLGDILTFLAKNEYMFYRNLSCFNREDNPVWDGTHNDYLFVDMRKQKKGA